MSGVHSLRCEAAVKISRRNNFCWVLAFLGISFFCAQSLAADWPDWRGPGRDGTSAERGLPVKWSPSGENLAWKAPYGGRSGPIVVGNHLYVQNSVGKGETLQERLLCLNADSGKLLWEHRFNVYLSDVPPHRVGWASPVADPSTGNVYVFGVGGTLLGLTKEGKLLWERSLGEEVGLVTTHGGRTVSPVIEGDLVIVSGVNSGWGNQARAGHRFMAFDKKTGQTIWMNSPGGRPYDTTYSPPIAGDINGVRLLIAGGGDGTVHSMKPQTGEPVWNYEVSKRGVNTGAVLKGSMAIVSHSEENLDTSEMGLLAAIDAGAQGKIGKDQVKWAVKGFQGGFSSPVIDGNRLYQIDNGSNLVAFDVATGKQLWTQNLGTIQKSSPVLAEGRLYVGTESGKFYILKPGEKDCEILDEDLLGPAATPEAVIASVAVSRGRIYLVSSEAIYCIGKKAGAGARPAKDPAAQGRGSGTAVSNEPAAHLQVSPAELILKPGEKIQLHARLFDAKGIFIKQAQANWTLERLRGEVKDGLFVASAEEVAQAGEVKAFVGEISGASRVRVIPPLPWRVNFDAMTGNAPPAHWVNATGKFQVREVEGNKVLVKLADNPFTKRARVFMGPPDWSNYTVEADVCAVEKRRQMGDAGVVAQRYQLTLFGNSQKLELQSWQPETTRTVHMPFRWKADTWYRMKLQVQDLPDGKVQARGKVWPVSESEPADWIIEKTDSQGNRQGSPGIYADAPFEVFLDNFKVTAN
jgi:outer membrane protein assembly factor BamB